MQKNMLSAELTRTTKTTSLLPAQRPQEESYISLRKASRNL